MGLQGAIQAMAYLTPIFVIMAIFVLIVQGFLRFLEKEDRIATVLTVLADMFLAGGTFGSAVLYYSTRSETWGSLADILAGATILVFVVMVIGILLDMRKGRNAPRVRPADRIPMHYLLLPQLSQWISNTFRPPGTPPVVYTPPTAPPPNITPPT